MRLAYRRSVVALQQAMGWKEQVSLEEDGPGENDGLLSANNGEGGSTAVRNSQNYGSVLDLPPERRVPKPKQVRGPVRVEAKVWFANEVCMRTDDHRESDSVSADIDSLCTCAHLQRTWISWLRVSLLIGSFSLAMYNSASFFSTHPRHPIPPGEEPGPSVPWTNPNANTIRSFAVVYALISIMTLGWGLFNYHRRLYLIRTKYAGDFDDLIGPPVICAALFIAVLLNFITRVQQHNLDLGN